MRTHARAYREKKAGSCSQNSTPPLSLLTLGCEQLREQLCEQVNNLASVVHCFFIEEVQ